MARPGLWSIFFLLSAGLSAQPPDPSFGLKLGKVPEILYAQVPLLPKDQGILVEAVEPHSPAWRGGLRKFDVIVSLDAKPAADAKGLDDKLQHAKAGQNVEVTLFRAGREMVLAFDAHRKEMTPENEYLTPKGFIKPGGPPAVTIQLQPMDKGRLNLVLSFYSNNSGKMERLAYNGQLEDIEHQIQTDTRAQRLPERVQDLVEVALRRVRTINQNQK
jgi:C-terminal processing protease CtpA/Prc